MRRQKVWGKDISPAFKAMAVQAVVFGALYLLRPSVETMLGYGIPLFWLMLAQGFLAAVVSALAGLSRGWVIGQALAPLLLLFALWLQLPAWVFPVIILLLVLSFWNVVGNRVPLYLTNQATSAALLALLARQPRRHFVDLGSGLGGTLRYLAVNVPETAFTGLETAPLPFALSWLLGKVGAGDNLSIRCRDIFRADLSGFDVVYCFLSPVPMARLYGKAKREMKPGSLFISNSFTVPGHKPDRIIKVKDRRKTKLLVWKM
ncbi:class I SAM-dependent methyltransferase [Sneathiella sp.]|uniref:class I SAM-dependent methyltransferase n=1 Tax=Sneathiella sp. TaxID=1964365 RepID=UPI003568119E